MTAASREMEAGHRCRAEGDIAAAALHYAEALRLDPYALAPFRALSEIGEAERAYESARPFMRPGVSAAAKTPGGTLAIFTISSNNYAAYARVLLDSVAEHYPAAQRFHIVVDRELLDAADYADGCHAIRACEIGIPDFDVMAFRYDVTELNTAVKPFAFKHLFDVERFETVLYFDPDVQIFGQSTAILGTLAGGASAVLTPHFTSPPAALDEPNDQTMLRSGAYNLGFLGVRRCEEGERLLGWWSRHLQFKCRDQQSRGWFVDQRFFDLAAGYFEQLHVCRSPGANVAYWNLAERPLDETSGGVRAAGALLEFFHFSGCDPREPGRLSKYTRRYRESIDPILARLVSGYTAKLERKGFARFAALPYSYGVFRSGRAIPKALREQFADHVLLWKDDPFATAEKFSADPAPTSTAGEVAAPRPARTFAARSLGDRNLGPALLHLGLGYYHERRRNFPQSTRHYSWSLTLRPDWLLPFRQLAAIGERERAYEIGRSTLEPGTSAAPRTLGGARAVFTIAANAQLAHARVLLDSVAQPYPDARRFLFVVDREMPLKADLPPGVHAINTREIGIPGFEAMAFRYDRAELSALAKPFAFRHLFEVEQFETALFFAPDTLVIAPSSSALDALAGGASMAVTPCFATPPAVGQGADELLALRMGAFDTGFMAMRRCEESVRLLDWWRRFLQFKAHRRPEAGLSLDSKPLDLALGYFEHIHIHRSPGANVGPWNLAERPLTRAGEVLHARGAPLEFVRFPTWSDTKIVPPGQAAHASTDGRRGLYDELSVHYQRLLDDAGVARFSRLPYSYDHFLSGRKIPDAVRARAAGRILYLGTDPFASDGLADRVSR